MARYRRYGSRRRSSKSGFDVLLKMAVAFAAAAEKQAREQQRAQARQQRFLEQQERSRARQVREREAAIRREERERAKEEREREKAARLQAKLEEQQRFEAEVTEIEDDNYLWSNVHSFVDDIISLSDVNQEIAKANYEQEHDVKDGMFKVEYPNKIDAMEKASEESKRKFDTDTPSKELDDARSDLDALSFENAEPTMESVTEELTKEAKQQIKAFFPWKKKKLRRLYIEERIDALYEEQHSSWKTKKEEYEKQKEQLTALVEQRQKTLDEITTSKNEYFARRTEEIFNKAVTDWTRQRDDFYDIYRKTMQNIIDGDKEYILNAINAAFDEDDEDELPMEYFVDVAFDETNGRVLVDLDLPEIEDVPEKKITLTPTGKKSIRAKSQTNLREDYFYCICGLSMFVAHHIFNVSLRINEIEIMGFTQRQGDNTAQVTDQYVLLVKYDRATFERVPFNKLTPLQILNLFQHNVEMTKTYTLKELNLGNAYAKMESFIPVKIEDYGNLQ